VLSATCGLQEAKDKFDQLQEQLTQRGIDLHAAEEQLVHLQKDLAGKCNQVTQLSPRHFEGKYTLRLNPALPSHASPPFFPTPPSPYPSTQAAVVSSQHVLCGISGKPYPVHCKSNATA
jgi:hypothetical protein